VREDVVDILLNLKGVVFRLHNRSEAILTLKKSEGVSPPPTSSRRTTSRSVNPEHVVAHLASGGKLEMQIKVEAGRGYVPGNMRYLPEETKGIGRIILDASFSPVRRVSYAVESARVEQRTDLDKLIMDIETNGAIEPEEAIRYAARVLVDQLSVFAQLEGTALPTEQPKSPQVDPILLPPGGRPRAHRALGQLPQGREHLLHRRPDPAHRDRAAEGRQPRPQVAERDQGSARLAAGWTLGMKLKTGRRPVSNTGPDMRHGQWTEESSAAPPAIARDAAQHDGVAAASRGNHHLRCRRRRELRRVARADDHPRQESPSLAKPPAPSPSTGCATAITSQDCSTTSEALREAQPSGLPAHSQTGFRKGDNAPPRARHADGYASRRRASRAADEPKKAPRARKPPKPPR
jgi:hypothetical protein